MAHGMLRSKVKVTWLSSGSAGRYDCLGFVVESAVIASVDSV